MSSGLLGNPRRTQLTNYNGHSVAEGWGTYESAMAVGGTLLFASLCLYFILLIYSAFYAPKGFGRILIGEVMDAKKKVPRLLENWKGWIGIAIALILLAYTIPIMDMIQTHRQDQKGLHFGNHCVAGSCLLW
ncbi:hypothetical protein F9U64_08640 [Gracilibacillus oryzae]|uniref:Uncharacterized protein n=1 Tax=Gracilibacillus oryzae TaxID=1672701 RepID=A0A7C8L446_9BACI|nr:hypothetical protein [Gracilibacillus oryzae]KAB8137574.1 hypothetical protein F9U64_08640 [Gracilibacillus oryzae]